MNNTETRAVRIKLDVLEKVFDMAGRWEKEKTDVLLKAGLVLHEILRMRKELEGFRLLDQLRG